MANRKRALVRERWRARWKASTRSRPSPKPSAKTSQISKGKLVEKVKCYENYPASVVFLSNMVSILTYIMGAYLFYMVDFYMTVLYLLYVFVVELRILVSACRDCYYYGKTCAFGRGKLCSTLMKRGRPKDFAKRQVSSASMIPDFLVFVFPIIAGAYLLLRGFDCQVLALTVGIAILSFGGNAVVRGTFACKYCKQREIGCPAQQMFNNSKKKK